MTEVKGEETVLNKTSRNIPYVLLNWGKIRDVLHRHQASIKLNLRKVHYPKSNEKQDSSPIKKLVSLHACLSQPEYLT